MHIAETDMYIVHLKKVETRLYLMPVSSPLSRGLLKMTGVTASDCLSTRWHCAEARACSVTALPYSVMPVYRQLQHSHNIR